MAGVAYFITSSARSYAVRGATGQTYSFSPVTPRRVAAPRDIESFRRCHQLTECDEDGEPVVGGRGTPRPEPLSVEKFKPELRKVTSNADLQGNAPVATRAR